MNLWKFSNLIYGLLVKWYFRWLYICKIFFILNFKLVFEYVRVKVKIFILNNRKNMFEKFGLIKGLGWCFVMFYMFRV